MGKDEEEYKRGREGRGIGEEGKEEEKRRRVLEGEE